MTVDSQLLLRMIDDDEYFQMVGGSADDVVEVLLLAPCEGEALSVNAHRFDTVASRASKVSRRSRPVSVRCCAS